jgi:hypothetical protein
MNDAVVVSGISELSVSATQMILDTSFGRVVLEKHGELIKIR